MEISERAMKLTEFKDSVTYRVACDCIDQRCDAVLDFEWDKKWELVALTIYKTVAFSSYWGDKNWFQSMWIRIKKAVQILFTGFIEMEESMLFLEGKHLEILREVIQQGCDKFKERERRIEEEARTCDQGSR